MNGLTVFKRFGIDASVVLAAGPDGTQNYVSVTIQSSQVASTLTDFRVYVDLSDLPAAFFTGVQSDGGDIRVTESDGSTRAPVELVSIDTGSSKGQLYFLASSLSSSTDTVYRIYYNATSTVSQPAAGDTYGRFAVWGDYHTVLHLETVGGAGSVFNSTSEYNWNPSGPTVTTGKIENGYDFDGTDNISKSGIDFSELTISMWVRSATWSSADSTAIMAIIKKFTTSAAGAWFLDTYSGSVGNDPQTALRWVVYDASAVARSVSAPQGSLSVDTWHHIVARRSETAQHIFLDGSSVASDTFATEPIPSLSQPVVVADATSGSRDFTGLIDELRIRSGSTPDAAIAAEYTNQNTPTTFYSVGSEQSA